MRKVNAVFVLRINALQKITARIIFKLRSVKGDFIICKPCRCKLIFGDSRISEKEYEINKEGVVTGYKVLLKNEQVATLEYRSHTWIGAIVKDINIITKRDQSVMRVAGWIIHELKG